jgi:hypothetical protein
METETIGMGAIVFGAIVFLDAFLVLLITVRSRGHK